ncbi:MAG: hypothetical protein JW801_03530 [Bacteroidales bacterium]|nr:hypothetical protein [Bacteroidales bacterium]
MSIPGNIAFLPLLIQLPVPETGTLILAALAVTIILLWSLSIIQILRSKDLSDRKSFFLLLLVFLLPILGAVVYFILNDTKQKDQPEDK